MQKKILFLFLILFSCSGFAQADFDDSKKMCRDDIDPKALKLYQKSTNKKKYEKKERIQFLLECLKIDPDFPEANLFMGLEMVVRCKLDNLPFTATIPFFLKAIALCPQIHSEPYYYIGFEYYEKMKNDSAVKYLQKFVDFKDNEDDSKFAKGYEAQVYQAKEMIKVAKKEMGLKKGVPFNPKCVLGVSTERDEYLAYISPDDQKCFFTRRMPVVNKDKVYSSDKEKEVFMLAVRDKAGVFNIGAPMPEPFNQTEDNQGGCSISIDNKHLYFAMMRDEGGLQPNCDVYVSDFSEEYWSEIRKLSPNVNDAKYWDSQPTIDADGVTLYFASDRPGGYGGIDLYVTKQDPITKIWGAPQNLGPKINSKLDEKTPFIHSDKHTLYFSSNGHFGFGGYDIFYARKNDKGEWMEPENIGSPINGATDDTGFFVSSDTKTGYFFSFNEGKVLGKGVGRYDLYSFDLYAEARPQEITFVKGTAKGEDGNPLTGARVEFYNTATKERSQANVDSLTGEFMAAVTIKEKNNIVITVKKDSVAFNSLIVDMKGATLKSPPPEIKIVVAKADKGKSFVINNIYYNTNSAKIKEESELILRAFADYLIENPNLTVEIQGHTDNVGVPKDNLALSTNRAYSIKQLLESYRVPGKRVSAQGYGQEKPIADNTSDDGRAKNRRTEFLIVEH